MISNEYNREDPNKTSIFGGSGLYFRKNSFDKKTN